MRSKVSRKQRKELKSHAPATGVVPSLPVADWAIWNWLRAHSMAASVALVLFATLRIVATYHVFNHTSDEPGHMACGMEWLAKGAYTYEAQHPPLARVAAALGPYLAGLRPQGLRPSQDREGVAILHSTPDYDRNLALSRLGMLPFFWIACLTVYVWARRYLDELTAVIAVFLFTFLPPVLAHAGLATTDIGLAAFTGAAFLSALIWLEEPSPAHSVLFGATVALAVLSKFSAVPFLPAAMALALLWFLAVERPGRGLLLAAVRKRLLPFGLAVLVGALVIWSGYRFSFGKLSFSDLRVPAPELFEGVRFVMKHNDMGHPAYLLGVRNLTGFWYYYPVVLAFKTPLPFLGLLFLGAATGLRKSRGVWLALAFSLGILLFSLTTHINIGVRHILPVYIGFAMAAAAGAVHLLQKSRQARWAQWCLLLALAWSAATSLLAHPDYLPYFNALAGDEPEKVLADSDLDWGQDMKRLRTRLQEVGARELAFLPFIIDATDGYPKMTSGFREVPTPGWNAVSLTVLKVARMGLYNSHPEVQVWPDRYPPTERIGKGILLYYFPP